MAVDAGDVVEAVKEWRDAREAVLSHQLEFERTKKGIEVKAANTEIHIHLLNRLANAEDYLFQLAKKLS